jgi:hypothetical protein
MEALSRIFAIAGSTMAAVSALLLCPPQTFEPQARQRASR